MILYIQTAFLGDLLLSIPTLQRLRQIYPDKKIHLLCRKNMGALLKENQLVDEVFDQFVQTKPGILEAKKVFSKYHYDLLICPHESFRSTVISAKVRAKRKIGYTNWFNRLVFDDCIQRPMHLPEVLRQLYLLSPLDVEMSTHLSDLKETKSPFLEIPSWSSMQLAQYRDPAAIKNWRQKYQLSLDQKIVCLAPGSVWPTKQWGLEKFSNTAAELIKRGHQVVLLGSKAEVDICEQIKQKNPKVTNLTGTTGLIELAQVIAASHHLVSNDSGAMHIASMTGTQTTGIFGPTVLSFGYQPWNTQASVVENKHLKCRPCSSHGGRSCPIGTHECMTSIEVASVLEKIN